MVNRAASLPTMLGEVIGNATNRIDWVIPQIALRVTVKIDGVRLIAGRYELRVAHGPCIGAVERLGCHLLLIGDGQKGR